MSHELESTRCRSMAALCSQREAHYDCRFTLAMAGLLGFATKLATDMPVEAIAITGEMRHVDRRDLRCHRTSSRERIPTH